jgi:hypothetical protein
MKTFLVALLFLVGLASEASACFPFIQTFYGQTVDGRMFVKPNGSCDIYFRSLGPTEGVRIDQRPQHGTVSVGTAGKLTYRVRAGYTGSDTFVYTRYGKDTRNRRGARTVRVLVAVE